MQAMKLSVLALAFFLSTAAFLACRLISNIHLNQGCLGYLNRAANSNTVELAASELGKAIKYIESNELTSGYTSVVYRTPDDDIGFWYKNISASLAELKATKPEASPLEKSNMLMKLKETLTENDGTVTRPTGLGVYPNNVLMAIWGWISLGGLVVFGGRYADAY